MDGFDEINESLNETMRPINGALRAISEFSEAISKLCRPMYEDATKLGMVLIEVFKPFAAARKLGEAQYVYWDYLDSDFVNALLESKNTNKVLRERNEAEEYRTVEHTISYCCGHALIVPYERLFSQSVLSYREKKNDLAVVGLLSIIDGLLTDVSGNNTPRFFERATSIMKRAENNETVDEDEIALIMLSITFQKTVEILSARAPFSDKEPKNLNRHWIMHGRSRRRKTKLDCIKLINFIHGLLLINEYAEQEVVGEGN